MIRVAVAVGLLALLTSGQVSPTFSAEQSERRVRSNPTTTDDDAVLLPRSVVPDSLDPAALAAGFDPDTTGSIGRAPKPQKRCDRLAWFPDRPEPAQFRQHC
jgi:hypothetical protein